MSGTPYRKKSRHRHRWSFTDALRLGSSGNRSQTPLSDLRLLYLLFCFHFANLDVALLLTYFDDDHDYDDDDDDDDGGDGDGDIVLFKKF